MEDSENPQQIVCNIENVVFFSNFDSGNLSKVQKTGTNTFELTPSPDAAWKGGTSYKSWFYFGIRGLKKGMYIRLSIINLGFSRPFASPVYRPVFRCLPSYPEWQRIPSETILEPTTTNQYKFTWSFEALSSDSEHFFAYSTPYPYNDIIQNISLFEKMCPYDSIFHRELLTRSLDGRDVELITISNKNNFSFDREEKIPGLFLANGLRAYKSIKPIIFISARVHPGETPASFLLDGILLTVLANDSRGAALRNNFVFKIVPVLNPDGVFRGNFRLDQNGFNLNRYYLDPSPYTQPTIYAVKNYFISLNNVKYYFDLHSHHSKRSCFLFGNFLGYERQLENQIFAKLVELNTQYFEFNECDFSEKSMSSKDPKDQHSKEGSGRVALFNSTGLIHTYTIECSYYMHRPLHTLAQSMSSKSGKRFTEPTFNTTFLIPVHNRSFFNDVAVGLLLASLDLENCNPTSRIPLSEFRTLDSIKDYLKARNFIQNRMLTKNLFRNDPNKNEKFIEKNTLPKLPLRKIHKLNIISPNFNPVPQTLYQKPKAVLAARGKSLMRE